MDEILLLAEQIVNSRFEKSDENYGLLVLSCYGLLSKYPDYQEIIVNTFKYCQFYIEPQPISNLLERHFIYSIPDEDSCSGVIYCGDSYTVKDHKLIYAYGQPKLLCSTLSNDHNNILNTVIHELLHYVKRNILPAIFVKNKAIIQSGLSKTIVYEYSGNAFEKYENEILEEVINTFQTTDIMKEIGKLNPNNLSLELKEYFQKLNLEGLDKANGYDIGVLLLQPLWDNDTFKNLVEQAQNSGNIKKLENEFNKMTVDNGFQNFSESLNYICMNINKIVDNKEEISKRIEYITSIETLYNHNTSGKKPKEKISSTFQNKIFLIKY